MDSKEIKRFAYTERWEDGKFTGGIDETKDGEFVFFEDYEQKLLKLRERNKELEAFVDKVKNLKHIPNKCIPDNRFLIDRKDMLKIIEEAKQLQKEK